MLLSDVKHHNDWEEVLNDKELREAGFQKATWDRCCFQHHNNKTWYRLRKKQEVKDSSRLDRRKGDIVLFGTSYKLFDDYRDWYYTNEDKKIYGKLNKFVPRYANEELGMVVGRHRWLNVKSFGTFRNYGTTVMMISGSKKGHLRKYGAANFKMLSKFPHDDLFNINLSNKPILKDIFNNILPLDEDERARDKFIEQAKELL